MYLYENTYMQLSYALVSGFTGQLCKQTNVGLPVVAGVMPLEEQYSERNIVCSW